MNNDFTFSNLLGRIHTAGQVQFNHDGTTLLCAVGNRVTSCDLVNNTVRTTFHGHDLDIDTITLSHDGKLLIVASHTGDATFMSYPRGVVLRRTDIFYRKVSCIQLSEDSEYLAVVGSKFTIYKVEHNVTGTLSSKPVLVNHLEEAKYTCVDWIGSEFILVGTVDGTVYLHKLSIVDNIYQISNSHTIAGNQSPIVTVAFAAKNGRKNPGEFHAIDSSGQLYKWTFSPKTREWKSLQKQLPPTISAAFSNDKNILCIGTTTALIIYNLSTFERMQELKCGKVNSIAIKDWIGISTQEGDIMVWDHVSETYILRQNNHKACPSRVAYNETGTLLATSDLEGDIKLHDTMSSNTITTIHHGKPITGIVFSRPPGSRDSALFASSKDGTVRAYDLIRNKNFRTYVCPDATVPLDGVAVDPSGELVCAYGEHKIYLWNVQTRQLLDVLIAHTAPVTQIQFSNVQSTGRAVMASSSWDTTVRVWDIFDAKGGVEKLTHSTEVICFAFRPDGTELISSTMDGQLSIWDVLNNKQTGYIEAKRDIVTAGISGTGVTNLQRNATKYFTSLCYTADGTSIICGGQSQFLCMYNVEQRTLLRRFVLSTNISIDGVINMEYWYIPAQARGDGKSEVGSQIVPGAQSQLTPRIQVQQVTFSPTNQQFAVALNPEGVMLYNNSNGASGLQETFQPLDIDPSITPITIQEQLDQGNYGTALLMSIRLNESNIIANVFNNTPHKSMDLVLRSLPSNYLDRFIQFLSTQLETSNRLEFILLTIRSMLNCHGPYIQQQRIKASVVSGGGSAGNQHVNLQASLRALIRSFNDKQQSLSKIANENKYQLDFLSGFGKRKRDLIKEKQEMEGDAEEHREEMVKQTLNDSVYVNKNVLI
ncbi:periodic tryptophan protein PWP2 [Acrasis kona]|uniref:Periodic tryptophan protein PWP2 n=1 Tax=Acrasis kona TaxID=1008807 RepID=A0AAW2ZE86_9EUKA